MASARWSPVKETAVEKAMERGDGRLAMRLLEKMGLTDAPKPGASEVEEVKRELAMEAREAEVRGGRRRARCGCRRWGGFDETIVFRWAEPAGKLLVVPERAA
jgi:hypothetical protein